MSAPHYREKNDALYSGCMGPFIDVSLATDSMYDQLRFSGTELVLIHSLEHSTHILGIIYIFFLCTIDSSQQISDLFYKTLISMVDCHGEITTKHFDQCGSHDDKNKILYILVALAKLRTR